MLIVSPWPSPAIMDEFMTHNRFMRRRALSGWGGRSAQDLVRRRGRRRIPAARDLNRRKCELDAVSVEGLLDHGIRSAAYGEVFARQGHHFHPDLDREVAELLHALHLEGVYDLGAELGIGGQLLADVLDDLFHLAEVGVVGHPDG